jgi:hypothetical protein
MARYASPRHTGRLTPAFDTALSAREVMVVDPECGQHDQSAGLPQVDLRSTRADAAVFPGGPPYAAGGASAVKVMSKRLRT